MAEILRSTGRAGPGYLVIGRGRWGRVVGDLLGRMGRSVQVLQQTARRRDGETEPDHRKRLQDALRGAEARVAWLCIPPGPEALVLLESALTNGLHVIAEKPWTLDETRSAELDAAARAADRVVAVHFQYCYLDGLEALASLAEGRDGCSLEGAFTLSRPNRLRLPAPDNLAAHLVAMQLRWFPGAPFRRLITGYEAEDARWLELDLAGERPAAERLDFTNNQEPIVQRFVLDFERAVGEGTPFALDFTFAARVRALTRALEQDGVMEIV